MHCLTMGSVEACFGKLHLDNLNLMRCAHTPRKTNSFIFIKLLHNSARSDENNVSIKRQKEFRALVDAQIC